MRTVFADTYYFLALLNSNDAGHEKAVAFTNGFTGRMVTTDWVRAGKRLGLPLTNSLARQKTNTQTKKRSARNREPLELIILFLFLGGLRKYFRRLISASTLVRTRSRDVSGCVNPLKR
jgi:hypothetical protein